MEKITHIFATGLAYNKPNPKTKPGFIEFEN